MIKTAIILHGTLGSPDGNWFQWAKERVRSKGHRSLVAAITQGEGHDDIKRDGFVFNDPSSKLDALLGIIKIK